MSQDCQELSENGQKSIKNAIRNIIFQAPSFMSRFLAAIPLPDVVSYNSAARIVLANVA